MSELIFKKKAYGTLSGMVSVVTRLLQEQGFGVLTRIDLDKKIQEKLGKEIEPTVILGVCDPEMAYEAFSKNTEVTGLLPCNVTIRKVNTRQFSIEMTKPSALVGLLHDDSLVSLATKADERLEVALNNVETTCGPNELDEEECLEHECWDRDSRWGLESNAEVHQGN